MRAYVVMAVLLGSLSLFAQQDTTRSDIDLEKFAERMFQVQDADVNYEDVYESLLLFYTDPLNLNKATEAQLASLYILSPSQIQSFMDYRDTNGKLLSIYELQAIDGFDLATIEVLLPFISLEESALDQGPLFRRIFTEKNRYLLLRYTNYLEPQVGYQPQEANGYLGDPRKVYGRFRTSKRDDFSLGFTFESDAGEPIGFKDGTRGFDFWSAHLMVENQGVFNKIILGDYQLQAGQGLVFGAGFNPGKGAETVNTVKRNTIGIRPYTSVLETNFFRGGALAVGAGDFTITAFGSHLLQDGKVQNDSLNDDFEVFVNSIQQSGFHRTPNEREAWNQLAEINLGGLVVYQPNRKLQLGITGISTRYSTPLLRTTAPYNALEFSGTQNMVLGTFGSYQWQNFNIFGEMARSGSGGIGVVGGAIASLSQSVDVAVSLRDYDSNFHSFYGNAFGEGSRAINERGVYWGMKYAPSRKYSVVGYYDKFSFPWLRFGVDAPSEGAEWLGRFTYNPSRSIGTFIQVREERKETSLTSENLSRLVPTIKRNYIFNIDYQLSTRFAMKSRVQTSTFNEGGSFTKGYAIIQDITYSLERWKFSGRMALFETDDFDNRQYVYEKDVLYAFSIPAYSGQGIRNYLLVQYGMTESIDLWMRIARFSYRDRTVVGSGLDESQGPNRTELKWMLRWKF
jgi:hypothetical protein